MQSLNPQSLQPHPGDVLGGSWTTGVLWKDRNALEILPTKDEAEPRLTVFK